MFARLDQLLNRGIRIESTRREEGDFTDEYENEYIYLCLLSANNPEARELAYNMIGHMRDRYHGKGERDISYMMVYVWYKYVDKTEALSMITRFVKGTDGINGPYGVKGTDGINGMKGSICESPSIGCWKDMKYLCEYIKDRENTTNHPIIRHCVEITVKQLMDDYLVFLVRTDNPVLSNVAKWIPRENSAHHWVYEKIWNHWMGINYPYLQNGTAARNKGRKIFRTWLSRLNAYSGTKEIKETQKKWHEIKVSKISYMNLWKAAMEGDTENESKKVFINNARFHILTTSNANTIVPLEEYVKVGCDILDAEECDTLRISFINYLWKCQVDTGAKLEAVIPILNVHIDLDNVYSPSMNRELCGAIGVACMIAQKSKVANRILVGETLVHLNGGFIDMLRQIRACIMASSTSLNIHDESKNGVENAIRTIRDVIRNSGMEPRKILPVVITNTAVHIANIRPLLNDGQHIVLWNVSNHLPIYSDMKQVVHITGTNPKQLNHLSSLSATVENSLVLTSQDITTHILQKKYL